MNKAAKHGSDSAPASENVEREDAERVRDVAQGDEKKTGTYRGAGNLYKPGK